MEGIPELKYSQEKWEEVRVKLDALYSSRTEDEQTELFDRVSKRGLELLEKYPDAHNYAMFHVLIGSTIENEPTMEYEDFPGEDSVELYIDNLAKQG